MPDRLVTPQFVEFDIGRWAVTIHLVDRFGTERWFKASADSGETYGDGIYFAEVDRGGNEVGR